MVVSKQANYAILLERNPWKTTGPVYSNSLLAEIQANNPTKSNIENLKDKKCRGRIVLFKYFKLQVPDVGYDRNKKASTR